MSTIQLETRTFHVRVPVLVLPRLRGTLVVRVTEEMALRLERPTRPGRDARAVALARALDAADAHRTAALAHRLPGL